MVNKKDQKDFPIESVHQTRLENEALSASTKENILKYHNEDCNSETHMAQMNTYLVNEPDEYSKEVINQTSHVPDEVGNCYSFSNYLLDPNSRRLTIVIGVLGFVLKFIKNLKRRSRKRPNNNQYKSEIKNILLMDEEIEASQRTIEVKKFVKTFQYHRISIEKNGKLYDSGRISPTDKI